MKSRGVRLQYSFEADDQRGGDIQNPLFDLLSALREHGSIQKAAKATGASYRHVWGALKHWQEVLGQPLVTWAQGQPARLTPFAQRLVWAETRARTRLTPHIEALRAELGRVLSEALDGSSELLTIFASHDLALPLLREQASVEHGLHIDLRFAGSLDALRALAAGRCQVAGFHVPLQLLPPVPASMPTSTGGAAKTRVDQRPLFARHLKPLLKPGRHKLIGCATRQQGLMLARGNPLGLHSLADLVASQARFVNRQAGSGTRLLLEHLLVQEGLALHATSGDAPSVEDSHLAVAAAVASGAADAGLGIQAAASQFGLDFVPLVEEAYFLVCLRDTLEQPPLLKLRQLLASASWREKVAQLPGYRAADSGEVLSLTRALPWWHFRQGKVTREPA